IISSSSRSASDERRNSSSIRRLRSATVKLLATSRRQIEGTKVPCSATASKSLRIGSVVSPPKIHASVAELSRTRLTVDRRHDRLSIRPNRNVRASALRRVPGYAESPHALRLVRRSPSPARADPPPFHAV